MRTIKDNHIQRRFTWNIHYDCNYRCPYCFFEGKWIEYKKRNIYLSTDEWMKYWDEIYKKYGRSYILITGGEPFTYPDFIELIKRLSDVHYPINISTNASGDLKSFVERIDPSRVSLSVSLQLHFEKTESFLEKVKFLRSHGFDGCINFVAYPSFIGRIGVISKQFEAIGEKIKLIPFWGRYLNKEYPFAYTQHEKDMIGITDSWFDNVRKKNTICLAGYNSALIFPDGKVARCGQIGEKDLLGSFLDTGFRLLDNPQACDAEFCPCDESKLFGEDEHAEQASRERQADDRIEITDIKNMNNSSLNDYEYNSGKIILESSPKAIFIQAAGPCNSSCVFCSRGAQYDLFDLKSHFEKFGKTLYPFISKAETLILTGSGEYLRLPQAKEILDFFDSTFPNVEKFFSTNASSLVPWVCDKIVNGESRYTIHASLHASNASLHKTITRMENFEQIIENIRYLMKARIDKQKPRLNLIFVATTLNIEDLPNFVRLASDLGADKVICYYNYIYIPSQKYLSCFFKQDLTNKILNEAEALAKKNNIAIDLPPRFNQKEYPKPGICREPFSQIMFNSRGHALPCDASEDCDDVLSEGKTLMDVWNGRYYQKLRKSLIEGSCSCFKHCLRANPASVNDFKSHVIHRGFKQGEEINILWGDNF